jgi:hypothetical protein
MSERTNFYMEGREFLAEPHHYVEIGLDNIWRRKARCAGLSSGFSGSRWD